MGRLSNLSFSELRMAQKTASESVSPTGLYLYFESYCYDSYHIGESSRNHCLSKFYATTQSLYWELFMKKSCGNDVLISRLWDAIRAEDMRGMKVSTAYLMMYFFACKMPFKSGHLIYFKVKIYFYRLQQQDPFLNSCSNEH